VNVRSAVNFSVIPVRVPLRLAKIARMARQDVADILKDGRNQLLDLTTSLNAI
jgi:hypothetical protein